MPSRRAVLAASAGALSLGVAGCSDASPPPDAGFDRPDDRWPTAGYDPAGTAHAPAGPDEAVEQWRTGRTLRDDPTVTVLSTPIVDGSSVYVATLAAQGFDPDEDRSRLVALDAASGETAWTVEFPRGLTGSPALLGDSVVVGGRDGTVYAVRNGESVWEATIRGPSGTPTVYGDRIYVPDRWGNLHALDRDGRTLWADERRDTLDRLLGDDETVDAGVPAVDDTGVFVAFQSHQEPPVTADLIAYDHGGDRRWYHELRGQHAGIAPRGPALANGTVYATAGGTVHAVDAASGEGRWRFESDDRTAGPPATDGDRVYVAATDLYALEVEDGSERWRVANGSDAGGENSSGGAPYLARPAVADGSVYFRAGAVDASTGDRLWGGDAENGVDSGDVDAGTASGDDDSGPDDPRPLAKPAVTAGALYLSHDRWGVVRFS